MLTTHITTHIRNEWGTFTCGKRKPWINATDNTTSWFSETRASVPGVFDLTCTNTSFWGTHYNILVSYCPSYPWNNPSDKPRRNRTALDMTVCNFPVVDPGKKGPQSAPYGLVNCENGTIDPSPVNGSMYYPAKCPSVSGGFFLASRRRKSE